MKRGDNNWLFIKHQDDNANPYYSILSEEESVISGLTINDLKSGYTTS
jgi:hypothetical protein